MLAQDCTDHRTDYVVTSNLDGTSSVVVICEHASRFIPAVFANLGLSDEASNSHAAWDPGAMPIAEKLAAHLDAPLIASGVSRLVYDCNRPPEAHDAMPAKSELIEVPGNRNLSAAQRGARANAYYHPFCAAVGDLVKSKTLPIIVTVHSFTPVYFGKPRAVEIGILHDTDTRLADAMLQTCSAHTSAKVMRNEPYGPEHGVTHTLKTHAIGAGHLNVMLEIRNDLISTAAQQSAVAEMLARWLAGASALLEDVGDVQCHQ